MATMTEPYTVPKRINNLGHYPTPLEPWPALGAQLQCELWAKRDDLIGLAFGGNKTRKLDYIVHDAIKNGADWLLTTGAPQSNHCRQTAAAAARNNLGCTLLLGGPGIRNVTGNLLLDYLMGAEVEWTTTGMHTRNDALEQAALRLKERGKSPYIVPLGGSNHLGVWAFVEAVKELAAQLAQSEEAPPDIIIIPSSSGGTQAGLVLGIALLGWKTRVLGISVDLPESALQETILDCIRSAQSQHPSLKSLAVPDLWLNDDMTEQEYASFSNEELETLVHTARTSGVLLDPVYTGRAFAGVKRIASTHPTLFQNKKVLFWHTGGTPALFTYTRPLAAFSDTHPDNIPLKPRQ